MPAGFEQLHGSRGAGDLDPLRDAPREGTGTFERLMDLEALAPHPLDRLLHPSLAEKARLGPESVPTAGDVEEALGRGRELWVGRAVAATVVSTAALVLVLIVRNAALDGVFVKERLAAFVAAPLLLVASPLVLKYVGATAAARLICVLGYAAHIATTAQRGPRCGVSAFPGAIAVASVSYVARLSPLWLLPFGAQCVLAYAMMRTKDYSNDECTGRDVAFLNEIPAYAAMTIMLIVLLRVGMERSNRRLLRAYGGVLDALERERRASTLKTSLIATFNHELRTPLHGVIGSLDLVLEAGSEAESPNRRRAHLETARGEARSLLATLEGLITLAQANAGQLDTRPEPLVPDELARAAAAGAAEAACEAGVRLVAEEHGAARVAADPRWARETLRQLVSNAVKFTPRGGEVRIGAAARPGRGELELRVTDTGCGIEADLLPRSAGFARATRL